jgi:hypothetical protein
MPASVRVGQHIRRNAVAYVALFVALSGTSYAASKITSKDIKKDAVLSKHVKNGQLKGVDIADNSLKGADIDEASLEGLGVADGSVTTPKLADQSVTSEKVADGTIVNADIANGAAISNAKLATISTPGKVSDSALSNNVAMLDGFNQTFTGTNTFNDDTTFGLTDDEKLKIDSASSATPTMAPLDVGMNNNTGGASQEVAHLSIKNPSSGITEHMLRLSDFGQGTVIDGILIESGTNPINTALNVSSPNIVTGLDIGSNDVKTSATTISSTELDRLDGTPVRSVNLPLGGWVNVDNPSVLDFAASDGTSPDFALVNSNQVIEYDDTSSGVADNDFIGTTVEIPADYAGSPALIIRASRDAFTPAVSERLVCDFAVNGGAPGANATQTITVTGPTAWTLTPPATLLPNDSLGIRCRADDGSGGQTADDVVRIFAVKFEYSATR